MQEEKLHQIALMRAPGIGSTNIKNLISYCGSAKNVHASTKGKLAKIPGVGLITANAVLSNINLSAAEQELENVAKNNAQLLFYTDKEYPDRLKQIMDAPPLLYVSGKGNIDTPKMVAIVGTRKATNYGKGMVSELIQGLKQHNTTIVSGLAYGIDIHAHKEALKNNLPTIGVMASGLDIIYPAVHKSVAMDMKENGALVSENAFGTKPDAPRFPARNRIIAGMVDVVIVVEAAIKGGALITAEIANSYNKDVFAIPGSIGESHSEGCNRLIKANKAHLLEKVKDIEYIMNWDVENAITTSKQPPIDFNTLSIQEKSIVALFADNKNELLVDDISWRSQISISEIAALLLQLEFKGIIKSLPGKKYKLNF
ncbi:MAG: DNA-processing protein DprA [Cyclobacteriaceae bacterium]|nr:DNA-processing protein DprA [Cyclobacteriaceae bacterium]